MPDDRDPDNLVDQERREHRDAENAPENAYRHDPREDRPTRAEAEADDRATREDDR